MYVRVVLSELLVRKIMRNGGKTVTIGISSYIKIQPSVGTRNVCNEKVGFFKLQLAVSLQHRIYQRPCVCLYLLIGICNTFNSCDHRKGF